MNKTEITKKQRELRKAILLVYELEKELTQEFVANHPDLKGAVLKYSSKHVTTYKRITGILSYDSTKPKLILECVIDKLTISCTHECTTAIVEMIPFSHFSTHRTTKEDYEEAAKFFINELCKGPKIKIANEDFDFSKFDTAEIFNQFYFVLNPEAANPDAPDQDTL